MSANQTRLLNSPPVSTLRFDTGQLGVLRQVIARIPALQASIADIATFRLVVDANFVIQELIHRIRCPHHGASAFEELVKATVIDVFAPRWLDTEVTTSAIPKAAKRSKVSELDLRAKWAEFRTLLKWDDSLHEPSVASSTCCDPDDLPYVLLEQKLNADGILSKDRDIARMGGHPLTLDFVLSTRKYARSAVTTASIRVMGVVLPALALLALMDLLRSMVRIFGALPDAVKVLVIVGGAIALLHPGSRKWLADRCADAWITMEPALNGLTQLITTLAATGTAAETQAFIHLQEATRVIRPKRGFIVATPRVRHRRRPASGPAR